MPSNRLKRFSHQVRELSVSSALLPMLSDVIGEKTTTGLPYSQVMQNGHRWVGTTSDRQNQQRGQKLKLVALSALGNFLRRATCALALSLAPKADE